jgi:hypothetical protein
MLIPETLSNRHSATDGRFNHCPQKQTFDYLSKEEKNKYAYSYGILNL